MTRRVTCAAALMVTALTSGLFAQGATQERPPVFLSESWRSLASPPDDHGAWPASQQGVASPNLQLTLHGTSGKDIQLVNVRGSADLYPLNLWTGTTTSPSAATLRDRNRFVDLTSPFAKIRWTVRTSGFHQVRPVVKLADGTWLVGDRTDGATRDWLVTEFNVADVHWLKLDIDRIVTTGNIVERPDLSKVDEIGFVDLIPGSGHGAGGWSDVAQVDVFAAAIPRTGSSTH